MISEYDYIIVGSGAGGSTLAYRLSENSRTSILVLEYGSGAGNPLHSIPKGFFFTLQGDRYTYHYPTQPIAGTTKIESWTRGKVVGGSTTVNGMMYSRGFQPDFDALAAHSGADHWAWDRILATYRSIENHALGGSPLRGEDGRLGISATGATGELADRIFAAAESLGLERVADVNASDDERIGYTPSTVFHGRRTSAATAFLTPAVHRANVTLETRTRVARILVQDGRAIGIEADRRGSSVTYHARREIIVAGGTIESPLLLERSGIGHPDLLARHGIDTVVESRQVGERVIEQHGPGSVQARLKKRLGATETLNSPIKLVYQGALYLATRRGPISTAGYDFTFHLKSDPSLDRPDLVGCVTPFAIDPTASKMKLAGHSGLLAGMYQTRPQTTSSVHISGPRPDDTPLISPHYFETDVDQSASSRILGRVRELLAAPPLADIIEGEDFPTNAVSSEPAAALEHGRSFGGTIYHAVGSCAMGPRPDDVVDAELRVRGIAGLRVVDASVLPFQVSANTAAPVMAIGWIAADLIENT